MACIPLQALLTQAGQGSLSTQSDNLLYAVGSMA